jgi:dolichyl-phosphate-mannose--protein O-mannosyl transferase
VDRPGTAGLARLGRLVAFAAGWLTWFSIPGRTMFLFYMTPLVPFLVIGVTLMLGAVLGPATLEQRRLIGLVAPSARTGRRSS